MEIIRQITLFKEKIKEARRLGNSIGFVPTMGFLHEGHLSLLRQARAENDLVVLSIFVNPLQFGAGEDFEDYPRDLERDAALAVSAGCDIIFAPATRDMYPKDYATFVEVERLTSGLCGASRLGHFRGVTTVVNKLFNIVTPDRAYFGQKDAQQAIIIRRMAKDLNMGLEIDVLPIIREADGLAMSSRNSYLTQAERKSATVLYRSLCLANESIAAGERNAGLIEQLIRAAIDSERLAHIDYIAVVDAENLLELDKIEKRVLIALAVRFGKTRLIDNIIVEV
ncbi:MAG: Pantothenate synthetase [Syntrophomonadaceae bacterium]|nr:Pantothenate synthetase [Bacillota bacterium]